MYITVELLKLMDWRNIKVDFQETVCEKCNKMWLRIG